MLPVESILAPGVQARPLTSGGLTVILSISGVSVDPARGWLLMRHSLGGLGRIGSSYDVQGCRFRPIVLVYTTNFWIWIEVRIEVGVILAPTSSTILGLIAS